MIPRLPCRKASAIARGTSASASTTRACISCSRGTAMAGPHPAPPAPRDDGLPTTPSHEPVNVGANGHTRDRDELDAVFGDGGDFRRLDHLRDERHLHRLPYITSGHIA